MTKRSAEKGPLLPRDIYCSVAEAAEYAGVTERTIRDWIKAELLEAHRPIPAGSSKLRVTAASLRRMVDGAG